MDERHLAAAALLVEVAAVDTNFDEAERARIIAFARERFELDEADAQSLVETAQGEVDGATQLYAFTTAIKNGFSYEDRVSLMETLWEVVYSDGHADPFEDQLLRRIGGLIAVTDRDRGHARKRAQARHR
ncbi:MAG: TerB family tellurite resistance protein [Rhodospirillaceae bacterium]|nr:TerB family tellurite resistance protein [Rhodospirillaceae bacterium]MBT5457910.1 TerB family tellurite resistance protein [Rhodospirillaceae bacterium]